MHRLFIVIVAFGMSCLAVMGGDGIKAMGADQSESEKAISKAIAVLQAESDAAKDTLEQAKIDRAIRELEALIETPGTDAPAMITFEVSPAALRKKFAGKAVFNPKTNELALTYDFGGKAQLNDFDVGTKKVAIVKKTLFVEAGDELTHLAQFRSFTVDVTLTFKEMNGEGLASTNDVRLTTGGRRRDMVFLTAPLGGTASKSVPPIARQGSVPVVFSVSPQKLGFNWANVIQAIPVPETAITQKEKPHQVVLIAGKAGCGFSGMTITGVPDPVWLKEFLGE